MSSIFTFLENKGVAAEPLESHVKRWTARTIRRFVREAREVLRRDAPPEGTSPYRFMANEELSGAPTPCETLECRLAHVDRLARFAVLYGDLVVVQDPFVVHRGDTPITVEWERQRLADDIRVLLYVKPLVEVGLARIASYQALDLCENCIPEIIKSGGAQRALRALRRQYGKALTVIMESDAPFQLIRIKGPEALLEHGTQLLARPPGSALRVGPKDQFGHRRVVGRSRTEIVEYLLRPIVTDLIQTEIHSRAWQLNYLTNREADLTALQAANPPDAAAFSAALIEGLSHSLPFVKNVSLTDMVALRRNEGEAFAVYRDSVAGLLKELSPRDTPKLKQAFNDSILPQLRQVDLAVANARKIAKRQLAKNAIIGTGLVAIGLSTGLLPVNFGQLVAAFGGYRAFNALQSVSELFHEPAQIRESKYYWLWKVRQHSERAV